MLRNRGAVPQHITSTRPVKITADVEGKLLAALRKDASREILASFSQTKRVRMLEQLQKTIDLIEQESADQPRGVQDEVLDRVFDSFESRLVLEQEAHRRVQERAKKMQEEESATRRIALTLTVLVLAISIAIGVYLADEKRFYKVHEFFAKWYYYLFVHDPRKGTNIFLQEGQGEFDLYS